MQTIVRTRRPPDWTALGLLALALPAAVVLAVALAQSGSPLLGVATAVVLLVAAAGYLQPRIDPGISRLEALVGGLLTALLAIPAFAGYLMGAFIVRLAASPPAAPLWASTAAALLAALAGTHWTLRSRPAAWPLVPLVSALIGLAVLVGASLLTSALGLHGSQLET